MNKSIISLVVALMLSVMTMSAQDSRGRTNATIVADVLAELPASTQNKFNAVMHDLTLTGTDGVERLAAMLKPADKGQNNLVEYALNGLAAYVTAPGRDCQRAAVADGLKTAIAKCDDNANRAFLMTLLQGVGSVSDAGFLVGYVGDSYLGEYAVNVLVSIPGTDEILLELMDSQSEPSPMLAMAAGAKGLTAAEPVVLKWIGMFAEADRRPYYKTLGLIGGVESMPLLAKAAKADSYGWEPDAATEAYISLLERVARTDTRDKAVSAARALLKATDRTNVRSAALNIIFDAEGVKALPLLVGAMSDSDRAYRVNALRRSEPWADAAVYAAVGRVADGKRCRDDVRSDIVNWLGANHCISEIDRVLKYTGSTDDALADVAIKAAGRIGGDKALKALVDLLSGPRSSKAENALAAFNGKIDSVVISALDSDGPALPTLLRLASARRMIGASSRVFYLLSSADTVVADAAYTALCGVVVADDFALLSELAEKSDDKRLPMLQLAMCSAMRNEPVNVQYALAKTALDKSSRPSVYYPLLAQSATPEAIAALTQAYAGPYKAAALDALLQVSSSDVADVLLRIAAAEKSVAQRVLPRYTELVAAGDMNRVRKYQAYRHGLELARDEVSRRALIGAIAATDVYQALPVVASYLGDSEVAMVAAEAVRGMVSRGLSGAGGRPVRDALEVAKSVYLADGSADSGYAVDNINGMLQTLGDSAFESVDADGDYENFELIADWYGDSIAMTVRGQYQVPLVATEALNTVYVRVVDDRLTVVCNGDTVADNIVMSVDGQPVPHAGRIAVIGGGKPIETLVRSLPSTPVTELSADEVADGFKLLFDGRSMHNFTGNTVDYTPENGVIQVSACYGSGGNLYTKDEYSDFIFRFEFCFDEPGVNNGVGIRTPMGVDAAYEGMEIQILDHDCPIYAGLMDYQVHGSVYGVIPAKRIVHRAIGEWSTEEIRVVGDHITVTVNGDVILDGDIREACQGHSIAPDGSEVNPYTVDHRNHPGLFNKKGHIGFLGHGSGLKFRNIRIKDLSTFKKRK